MCQAIAELNIVCLEAEPQLVEQRHEDREDNQSDKFKKGRHTKVDNIKAEFGGGLFDDGCLDVYQNNNQSDQDHIMKVLKDLVYGNR